MAARQPERRNMAQDKWINDRDLVSQPQVRGDAVVASLRGEIDLHTSNVLRSQMMAIQSRCRPKRLILNLDQVPYMDSSAVAVLVEVLQLMRPGGGGVVLVGLQPRVKGLMEIARLDTLFGIAATEDEALARPSS